VRAAQNVAGVMGYTDTVFPDKQFRAAFDLPERDAYTQYAVDQMLANMAAEMPERADEFAQAMIDQKGAAWDEAMKRIGKTQFGKYIGAPLALDFFPEGERGQRELRVEYSKALDKYMTGDSAAYSKFFDEHPEYEVQREAWRDPAQRMSKLLISKIWDRYLALDSASKKKGQEQFGKQFKEAFLNAATRSYETIDNATLATWAKSLGGIAPETAGGATMQIETTDPEIVKGIDAYYAQRDQLFPNVAQYQPLMFSLPANQQKEFAAQFPQYQAYQQWRNQYIASHPELTSYLTSEQSELNGLPAEIQQAVYQYRANKDQLFPGIDDVQSQYYAQPEASRKAWLKQHPELSGYWEWKRQFTAAYPKAAAWIMSEQSMSNAVLGYSTPAFDPSITGAFSPELSSALLRYVYNGEAFSSGAMMELERVWKENGQPGGTFEAWISLMKDYFKQ